MATRRTRSVVAGQSAPPSPSSTGRSGKGVAKRVQHTDPRVENIKNARITVGATHVPQLVEEEADNGVLGDIFDTFAQHASGAFGDHLRDKWDSSLKTNAEQAFLEGKSLDAIEDKNETFEFYYRGAQGKKLGVDTAAQVQAMYDEHADEPEFDIEAAAAQIVQAGLAGADADTAQNAVAQLQRMLPALIDKENTRRTTKARLDVFQAGQEADSKVTEALFAGKDYEGVAIQQAADFEDAKALPGMMKPKVFNMGLVSNWIAALKDPTNPPSHEDMDEMERVLKEKNINGSSLWFNPQHRDRLVKAFAMARAEKTKAQSVKTKMEYNALLLTQADIDQVEPLEFTLAREGGQFTNTQVAQLGSVGVKTRKVEAEMIARVTDVTIGPEARNDNPNAFAWVNDPAELKKTTERMVQEFQDDGADRDPAIISTAVLMEQDHGAKVAWLDNEAMNRVRANDFAFGLQYLEGLQSVSNIAAGRIFGDPNIRSVLEYYKDMSKALDSPSQAAELAKEAFKALPAAKLHMAKRDQQIEFDDALADADITNVGMIARIKSRTAMGVAIGTSVRMSIDEAIRLEGMESTVDADGVVMNKDNEITHWAKNENNIQDRVREDFLLPWFKRNGIETNLFFSTDGEFAAIIRPLPGGIAVIEDPSGTIVGQVPLEAWSLETFKVIQGEIAAEIAAANAKRAADAAAKEQRLERGGSRVRVRPTPDKTPKKQSKDPGPSFS